MSWYGMLSTPAVGARCVSGVRRLVPGRVARARMGLTRSTVSVVNCEHCYRATSHAGSAYSRCRYGRTLPR